VNDNPSAVNKARLIVIDKLAAYRDDPTDERLVELNEAIGGWHRAVRERVGRAN